MTGLGDAALVDPDGMVGRDPYPGYRTLRETDPVSWNPIDKMWRVSRHADVAAILRDRAMFVVDVSKNFANLMSRAGRTAPDLQMALEAILFFRNPPGHAAERRVCAAALSGEPLAQFAETARRVAAEEVKALEGRSELDLVADLAERIPPRLMGRLIGIDPDKAAGFADLASTLATTWDRGRSLRFYERMDGAVAAAKTQLVEIISERRVTPEFDAISRLISGREDQPAADDETAMLTLFLFMASVDTSITLIGNCLHCLLAHPEALRCVVADRRLLGDAIEETIRFEAPVQRIGRVPTADVLVAGQTIKAGEIMALLLGSANRDPEVFDQPDAFQLDRDVSRHVGFGGGSHFCIGANIARVAATAAVDAALSLNLCTEREDRSEWLPHRTMRRLKSLPVSCGR